MKAKKRGVEFLNQILTEELTVMNQYFLLAKMCDNWGYDRLEKTRGRSFSDKKDTDGIIERMLSFQGVPNVQRLGTVKTGKSVPEQFKSD